MRLHPVPISLTLASLVGCTVCGEGTEKEGRECVPVGSVSRDGDEADDGQQADEGDQTRVVTAAGRTVTLRSWEGQVSVPGYSPDRIQLRSLLGGAVAPDADGQFLIEVPDGGSSLVSVYVDDTSRLGAILIPSHPLITERAVEVNPKTLAVSDAYLASRLFISHPIYSSLALAWMEGLAGADAVEQAAIAGLQADSTFLHHPSEAYSEAQRILLEEARTEVEAWAEESGYGSPFAGPAVPPAAGPEGPRHAVTTGSDDVGFPGLFEPGTGADLDYVNVMASPSGANELFVQANATGTRWAAAYYSGNLIGFISPAKFEVPSPTGFVLDLGIFFYERTTTAAWGLVTGAEPEDVWEELLTWFEGQFSDQGGIARDITMTPGESRFEIVGPGLASGLPSDPGLRWGVPMVLTITTELVLPYIEVLVGIEGVAVDAESLSTCITDLTGVLDHGQNLVYAYQDVADAIEDGDRAVASESLKTSIANLLTDDAVWRCMGFDALFTIDGARDALLKELEGFFDRSVLGFVGIAVDYANARISSFSSITTIRTASSLGVYAMYAPEQCENGIDDDYDGWVDLDDPGCDLSNGHSEGRLSSEHCNNGIDDDGDGAVDAADPQCLDGFGVETETNAHAPIGSSSTESATARMGQVDAAVLLIGDLTGDGIDDLLTTDGSAAIWQGPLRGIHGDGTEDHAISGVADEADIGDVDGDGYLDLVVMDKPRSSCCDEVYWFLGPISGTGTSPGDALGGYSGLATTGSVVSAGDLDGDSRAEVIVGDLMGDGTVYILDSLGGPEQERSDALARLEAESDVLGYDIAVVDIDGSGTGDVFVGELGHASRGTGAVYGFLSMPTGTVQAGLAHITISGSTAGERLGAEIVRIADFDGDGLDDLMLGNQHTTDSTGEAVGSVYLFSGAQLTGSHSVTDATAVIEGSSSLDIQHLGAAETCTSGDLDRDGLADIIIGTSHADIGGDFAGGVFVWYGGSGLAGVVDVTSADAVIHGDGEQTRLGTRTASGGDLTGDGWDDLVSSSHEGIYLFGGGIRLETAVEP